MGKETEQEYLSKFGAHLRAIRKSKKLALRKLAALCTTDYSDISKIENGKKSINLLTIRQLAEALEIPPKDLLDFE